MGYNLTAKGAQAGYHMEVARGNVTGQTMIHKFGRADITTGWVDIWTPGTVYPFPTTASTLEAISSDVNDTSAGSGARTITVEGLDASWDIQTETITMNGTSASTATSGSFIRVYRAWVATSGTYGTLSAGGNAGTITIRVASAGATLAEIALLPNGATPGSGQTEMAIYTIPNAKTGYLHSGYFNVDGNKSAQLALWKRDNADDTSAPVDSRRLLFTIDGLSSTSQLQPILPIGPLNAKTDVWMSARGSAAGTSVDVDFEIHLIDN